MQRLVVLILALAAVCRAETFFKETFDASWTDRWVQSDWKKDTEEAGDFELTAGDFYGDADKDQGIQTPEDARFYAYTAKLDEPFSNKDKDLVFQFSVKHAQKIDCGGGYFKLLPADTEQESFNGDAPYHVMFGPDICGSSTKKVHAIFGYEGENLLITNDVTCETDQLTHIYTFVIKSDDTYEILIDGESKQEGSVYDDWEFEEPKQIPDPDASKPDDWIDSPMMDDPEDVKPEDWDDAPETIPDPDAEKPEDWDDEADGTWESPEVPNPDFQGPWAAKKIDNPDYKGPWEHPLIDNPDYEHVEHPTLYDSIGAVGVEIWQVKAGTIFDNIIITDSLEEATAFAEETFGEEARTGEKEMFDTIEEERRAKEKEEREAREAERKAEEEARAAEEAEEATEDEGSEEATDDEDADEGEGDDEADEGGDDEADEGGDDEADEGGDDEADEGGDDGDDAGDEGADEGDAAEDDDSDDAEADAEAEGDDEGHVEL